MNKIIGIFIVMLLICTSIYPVISIQNDKNIISNSISFNNETVWNMTYGYSKFDMLHCVHETDDGGFIACGTTESEDPDMENVYRPWVLRVDSSGNKLWDWTLTHLDYENNWFNYFDECWCTYVIETSDGGFITCFRLLCSDGVEQYWICGLVKLSNSGELEWLEYSTEGLVWSFCPYSIIELEDGSFIAAGMSGAAELGDEDDLACLYKFDEFGIEQWHKEYNYGNGYDDVWGICQTNDNGYLLTGNAATDQGEDYWMIKTDINGNEQWSKTFGGEDNDFAQTRNCFQTDDGGYIMCGYSYSFGAGRYDLWIVKTDSNGNMVWNKTYGENWDDVSWSFQKMDDGYIFCVSKNINYVGVGGDRDDIHLVKTDNNGNIEWVQIFGGPGIQIGQYVSRTSDGGLIVSGRTGRYLSDSSDGLLVKFSMIENQRPNKPETPEGPSRGEPDAEYTFSTISSDPDGDLLEYMWDWGDGNYSDWIDTTETTYTWTYKDRFEIRVKARDEKGGESDWSDPLAFSTPKIKNLDQYSIIIKRLLEKFPFLKTIIKQ